MTLTQRWVTKATPDSGTSRSGRVTATGTQPRWRPNPTHRRQWLHAVTFARADQLPRWARPTAMLLAARSSDAGRPVFTAQARAGRDLGYSARTIRRHIAALVGAGLIRVKSHRPVRDPATGRWTREVNVYQLILPNVLVSPRGHRRPVNPPDGVRNPPPSVSMLPDGAKHPAVRALELHNFDEPPPRPDPAALRAGMAAAREALAAARRVRETVA